VFRGTHAQVRGCMTPNSTTEHEVFRRVCPIYYSLTSQLRRYVGATICACPAPTQEAPVSNEILQCVYSWASRPMGLRIPTSNPPRYSHKLYGLFLSGQPKWKPLHSCPKQGTMLPSNPFRGWDFRIGFNAAQSPTSRDAYQRMFCDCRIDWML